MAAIRPFTPSDTADVVALILGIQRDEFGFSITAADQPDLHAIPEFYRDGRGEFWVAIAGDRIVGTIALKDIGADAGALRKMFVAADYRGAACGVAQALLDTLIGHAQRSGLRTIYLGTTEKFRAAHRFYEKNGFRQVGSDTLPTTFPRMNGDTRFYRLDLYTGTDLAP
jgi:N-acetylglutamate synthase-like GNAT family acetyltransferase